MRVYPYMLVADRWIGRYDRGRTPISRMHWR